MEVGEVQGCEPNILGTAKYREGHSAAFSLYLGTLTSSTVSQVMVLELDPSLPPILYQKHEFCDVFPGATRLDSSSLTSA